jgi:hypothetical protein
MAGAASGFFAGRRPLDVDLGDAGDEVELVEYRNVPQVIGAVLSRGLATLRDLDEHYSVEDCYDLLEVATVDAHNRRLLMPKKNGG